MCLVLLAVDQHPRYRFILAANRDEFHDRPTRMAEFWRDAPQVLAGRDLSQGGTWLGITRQGRFAALTNFLDRATHHSQRPSRGQLVSDFLRGDDSPESYIARVDRLADEYNGFSLIVGAGDSFVHYSNKMHRPSILSSGVYGLSNHLLDTPWPKVRQGKEAVAAIIRKTTEPSPEALFSALTDRTVADDAQLSMNDLDLESERLLSAVFVDAPGYGTRSSTVILIDHDGVASFAERTYRTGPDDYATVTHIFRVDSS
jgi:uncharacterized protein with NRDE domain